MPEGGLPDGIRRSCEERNADAVDYVHLLLNPNRLLNHDRFTVLLRIVLFPDAFCFPAGIFSVSLIP